MQEELFDWARASRFATEKLARGEGLPHVPYEAQVRALRDTAEAFGSGKFDNVIIVSPTGSGKSLISVCLGLMADEQDEQTMILTPTRQLQNQTVNSFRKVKALRSFKGRANYPCLLYEDPKAGSLDAANAPCTGFDVAFEPFEGLRPAFGLKCETDHPDLDKLALANAREYLSQSDADMETQMEEFQGKSDMWEGKHQTKMCTELGLCPYRLARDTAQESPVSLLNLKSYLVWNIYARESPFFKPRMLTVFDECHTIEDQAKDFYTLALSQTGLSELYEKVMGRGNSVEFKGQLQEIIKGLLRTNTKALLKSMTDMYLEGNFDGYAAAAAEAGEKSTPAKLIKYHKILKLASDPKMPFAKALVRPGTPEGKDVHSPTLKITPIELPPHFANVYGQYNVFMSATIADVDVFCNSLCLDRDRTKVLAIPDSFPIEHRPIIPWPIARVNKKTIDADAEGVYGKLADALSEIASSYPKHRIMVHTSSYAFGAELEKRMSAFTVARLLRPKDGIQNKEMIAKYTNRADLSPYILVSPACREGYDFEGELCRIQVFMKCPFPSLGDAIIKLKLASRGGKAWYAAKVATAIRQQYGRSTRHAEDFSVTFFLDTALIDFVTKHPRLFPTEFHQALALGRTIDWHGLKIDKEKLSY